VPREVEAELEGATQRQKRLRRGQKRLRHPCRGCRIDAEDCRGCAVPQRADAEGFGLMLRLGGLMLSFKVCWRGFHGADFPNSCF